jgi:hypothetical protein
MNIIQEVLAFHDSNVQKKPVLFIKGAKPYKDAKRKVQQLVP